MLQSDNFNCQSQELVPFNKEKDLFVPMKKSKKQIYDFGNVNQKIRQETYPWRMFEKNEQIGEHF